VISEALEAAIATTKRNTEITHVYLFADNILAIQAVLGANPGSSRRLRIVFLDKVID